MDPETGHGILGVLVVLVSTKQALEHLHTQVKERVSQGGRGGVSQRRESQPRRGGSQGGSQSGEGESAKRGGVSQGRQRGVWEHHS